MQTFAEHFNLWTLLSAMWRSTDWTICSPLYTKCNYHYNWMEAGMAYKILVQ